MCQGYDLSLTRYANEGSRATFYITGREHSATAATGSAREHDAVAGRAGVAWEVLNRSAGAAQHQPPGTDGCHLWAS